MPCKDCFDCLLTDNSLKHITMYSGNKLIEMCREKVVQCPVHKCLKSRNLTLDSLILIIPYIGSVLQVLLLLLCIDWFERILKMH